MKKIKLFILIHSLEVGGAEGQVYELARGFDKDLYEVVVGTFTATGPYIDKLRAEGVQVQVLTNRLRQIPWKMTALVAFMRRERFDIVQNVMFTAAVIGTIAARLARVPVVINCIRSLGFLHYHYRRPIKRMLYRVCDKVIANSQQTATLLVKHGILAADKVVTVYNGVDTERFQPSANDCSTASLQRSLGIGAFSPIVGMVANLSPVKNHHCLLRAIPTVLQRLPRAAFLFIGAGALKDELHQEAESLGIQKNVFFWARARIPLSCFN